MKNAEDDKTHLGSRIYKYLKILIISSLKPRKFMITTKINLDTMVSTTCTTGEGTQKYNIKGHI